MHSGYCILEAQRLGAMRYLGYTHEILVGTTREQAYDRGYQFDLIRGLWTGGFGIGFIIEKVSFLNWSNNNF